MSHFSAVKELIAAKRADCACFVNMVGKQEGQTVHLEFIDS